MSKTKVAVYGSLREGMGNHRLLIGSDLLGHFNVEGFEMYSYGAFPFIKHGDGTIIVEVYEVDEETFKRLDRLEGYPSFYDRELIEVGGQHQAWIYFIEQDASDNLRVENGDWKDWKKNKEY